MKHKEDQNSIKIRNWIAAKPKINQKHLLKYLQDNGHSAHGITHLINGDIFEKVRKEVVKQFKIE